MSKKTVTLSSEFIRLDDLLKVCGFVITGGQAKVLIQRGGVKVDGSVCLMRGKKLRGGETVTIPETGEEVAVVCP